MIKIGQYNKLTILKETSVGLYLGESLNEEAFGEEALGDQDFEKSPEILLPLRYVPKEAQVGQELEVFIAYDSEDRLIATTERPLAQVGEFACLEVVAIEAVGAFLDWGLSKDLFLPYREQTRSLRVGHSVVVAIYLDNTNRIAASMRLERFTEKSLGDYKIGEAVNLFIASHTDLGFKAIINGKHWGVLYKNETFQKLEHGQQIVGYIKNRREDGKIDLTLQKLGHHAADDIGPKILEMLRAKNGFLPVNDKTSAELIYDLFGVSKKKYKMALGGLYKKRLILVEDDGIRLVQPGPT